MRVVSEQKCVLRCGMLEECELECELECVLRTKKDAWQLQINCFTCRALSATCERQ